MSDVRKRQTLEYQRGYKDAKRVFARDINVPNKDLISRQDAIDAMATWDWQEMYLPIHFKQLLEDLPSAQPTADVVEVVRCEDCRYWENRFDVMVCNLTDGMKGAGDFCSYGERREDGTA